MLKFAKKPGNFTFIVVALFILTVVGTALVPSGQAAAAPASGVGYVDFRLLVAQHPDAAAADQTIRALTEQSQKEFESKSAGMNDQDKRALFAQMSQQIDAKQMELVNAIQNKVLAAIKDVAEKKGLSVVLDKGVTFYGGEDITAEVGKKIAGQ